MVFIASLNLDIMSCMPIHCSWTGAYICLKGTEMLIANTAHSKHISYEIRTLALTSPSLNVLTQNRFYLFTTWEDKKYLPISVSVLAVWKLLIVPPK